MKRLIVFASGQGTNLQAILSAISDGVIPARVRAIVSNFSNCGAIEIAKTNTIPYFAVERINREPRLEYDTRLWNTIAPTVSDSDIIVLAGWDRILTSYFLDQLKPKPIVNLHPALPGQFPGADGIGLAFKAFEQGKIWKTGAMAHYVIPEIDAGQVIRQVEVPIYKDDTEDILRKRVRYLEKSVLLGAIMDVCQDPSNQNGLILRGKVRQVFDMGSNIMRIEASDKLSAFDRHICNVPGKGKALTAMNHFWMSRSRHIIPNHLLFAHDNVSIVRKCMVIPIEVVVRGYMCGSTGTSIWTHYKNGIREYCGHHLRDGYSEWDALDTPLVTPTTKSDIHDALISDSEIVGQGILDKHSWDYIQDKALQLYTFGVETALKYGYILADTKYEFGRCYTTGEILLIDEMHTCDSSRYWLADGNKPPKSVDKDVVRRYISSRCDPYHDPIPDIPGELVEKTAAIYNSMVW